MESLKLHILTLLVFSFGLAGCYTQLEYGQRMKRITEDRPARGYAQNEEPRRYESEYDDEVYYEEYEEYEDEEYIPIHYKDYDRADWWSSCYCSPGTSYYFNYTYYNDPWYYDHHAAHYWHHDYPYYYGLHSPFLFSRWNRSHFGFGYHHSYWAFSLHWGAWGHPYHHSYWWWDYPYYSSFGYGPSWAGYYYRPYWYGSYGYYVGNWRGDSDRRVLGRTRSYGPRSIGTSRVSDIDRGESRVRSINRPSTVRDNTGSSIRSRGTMRIDRGSIQQNRTRVDQPRSRGTRRIEATPNRSRSDNGIRSRGSVQEQRMQSRQNSDAVRPRTRDTQNIDRIYNSAVRQGENDRIRSRKPAREYRSYSPTYRHNQFNRSEIESNIRSKRVVAPVQRDDKRSSIFGRIGNILKSGSTYRPFRIEGRSDRNSVRSSKSIFRDHFDRGSSRQSINRSGSSDRSSVTRSRTSSSSRSRGTSSNNRSSSSRSRGNN